MNHSYRLIFSSTTSSLIPVAENTRGQGKANRRNSASQFKSNQTGFTLRYLCAALAIVWGGNVHALPQGGQVSSGSGSISQSSNNMTVQQNSQNLSINWQSFGIGAGQSVQFKQPSASSIALNRVLGQDPSQILGNLSANGQVFITNPNGVLFGHGAQVNVGGLVASTGNLTDADLQAKHYRFSNSGTGGTVSNDGTLHAADGGYIALLAPEVRNKGVISARLGTVLLGAGNQTTLQLDNGSLVGYNIDKGAINALADNKQLIQADGGRVIMSAKAANQLARAVVNNSGVIEARTLQNKEGVIRLLGDTKVGEVNLKGTLDASAANGGNGGSIETSAENVKVAKSAVITTAAPTGKTGNWLIKQSNNFIVDNGGNISGDTLGKSLNQTNVTVRTLSLPTQAGDIAVNDFVEWLSSNNLALSSHRDINVNATIANRSGGNLLLRADATGNGTGTVNFGTAGKINQTGGRTDLYYNPVSYTTPTDFTPDIIGSFTGWMLVNDVNHLQAINTNLSGNYALGRNIDASATASWNGGAGFVPIGQNTNFNGQFDGLNHTISDLHINRPTESNVGLFGTAFGPISNVGLVRGSVSGGSGVGGVVAFGAGLTNVFYKGTVTGSGDNVGGLVGFLDEGSIEKSWSNATVTGGRNVGGLVGSSRFGGGIGHSYSKGAVTGSMNVGGLVGELQSSFVSNSWSSAKVTGDSEVGGLVGTAFFAPISNSHATGAVTGSGDHVGGLIGSFGNETVSNSYATGTVKGRSTVGGLVGFNGRGTVDHSFSTGTVIGTGENIGGLVGFLDEGYISNSWSNATVTGDSNVGGLAGASRFGSVIDHSHAKGTVTGTTNVGGLVGLRSEGGIDYSWSNATVTGVSEVGGLVGLSRSGGGIDHSYARGAIKGTANVGGRVGEVESSFVRNSWSSAEVSGLSEVGGLVGANSGTISNASSTSNVTGRSNLGGLVGTNWGTLQSVSHTGDVSGRSHIGGLVGVNLGTITTAYSAGNVTAGDSMVGGLVGRNLSGTLTDTHSTATVKGNQVAGGLVGYADSGNIIDSDSKGSVTGINNVGGLLGVGADSVVNISDVYSIADVKGAGPFVGGLVGQYTYGTIKDAHAGGTVIGGTAVGGLVGLNHHGTIIRAYASGPVTGDSATGGLVGDNGGTIQNAYAKGNVTGNTGPTGGLVGLNRGTITSTYSTGKVTGNADVGGLVGRNDGGTVTSSYWDIDTSGQATSDGGTGLTDSQMKHQASFVGFDFANVWGIHEGTSTPFFK